MESVLVVLIFSTVVAVVSGNECNAQGAVNKLCTACQQKKGLDKEISVRVPMSIDSHDGACRVMDFYSHGHKVYFHAWNGATLKNIPGGTTIVYDKVLTNQGNGYNHKTGTFTAPRDGPYVFTWTALTQRMHRINLHLVVKGKLDSVAQADGTSGSSNGSGSNTVVVELKKGDVVYVKCGAWGTASQRLLYGYTHSTFSGWAI